MKAELVFETSVVTIFDVVCGPGSQPQSEIEIEPAFALGFPRRGIYIHESPEGRIVADPTIALLRRQGAERVTIHPTNEGDRNTEVQFVAGAIEPVLDRRGCFRRPAVSITEVIALRHQRFLAAASATSRSPLEVEEEAFALLRGVLEMDAPADASPGHKRLVNDAREHLATNYRQNIDLATVARHVGSSPFHLSRVFKHVAGQSMTAYRSALRIRHVTDRIAEGAEDLSALAIDAGFHDHAHMTNAFRQRTGVSPSALRPLLAR
jgi:AraC-like DNA-binding protein